MDWALHTHQSSGKRTLPRLDRVHTYWRMRGPSGKVLDCALYGTVAGPEVRCGYGDDDPLRTQLVPDAYAADAVAQQWHALVVAVGSFTDVS